MSYSRRPRVDTASRVTTRLRDLALDEREHAYYGPRMGDWLLLGVVVVGLLANGLYVWHQLGPANDQTGRAIFFGLALLAAFWAALVFTFKLSACVRVGAHSMSIVRGPWHTELAWAQVARLVERVQVVNQRRLRWVVAVARDGRSLQVREDMVTDYGAFRVEVWERYRLWRDHGGTWGTTGGGPFTARETASSQTAWWGILGVAALLPGLYFSLVLTDLGIVGPILVAVAAVCSVFALRAVLRRRTYTVDAKAIQSRQLARTTRLAWRDVKKIERTRRSFGGVTELSIRLGRAVLSVAVRGDSRVESFDWSPRVPEYLILRGAGRQVRIRLHRLARPDEMLAWAEFYERAGRHLAEMRESRRTVPPGARLATGAPAAQDVPDLARAANTSRPAFEQPNATSVGPADPWAGGREGNPQQVLDESAATRGPATSSGTTDDPEAPPTPLPSGESSASWLRAETSSAWHPGMRGPTPAQSSFATRPEETATAREEKPVADVHTDAPAAGDAWTAAPRPDVRLSGGIHPRLEPQAIDATQKAPEPSDDSWNPPKWRPQPAQAAEPAAPTHPDQGWHSAQHSWQERPVPSGSTHSWPPTEPRVTDAAPPEEAEDTPAEPVEPLADAFRLWGAQASNERPRFPRYGPPVEEEHTGTPDPQQFERDDFLR